MSSEELLKKTQHALYLEPRLQFKILKQIGFEALEEFKSLKDPTIDELKNYKEIFSIVSKVPAISNKFQIVLTKIINQYLHILGCGNPRILFKKSTRIELTSGLIAMGDPFYASNAFESLNEIELINCGKAYFFDTRNDGLFNIQVRIVEAPEPALTSKEYKNVVAASPTILLNFPTGKLAINDGILSTESKNQIEVSIAPGNYKCQVFIFKFPSGDYSFYTVLSNCEKNALNNEREIITLEPIF